MIQTQLVTIRDAALTAMPEIGFGFTLATVDNALLTVTTIDPRFMGEGVSTPSLKFKGMKLYIPQATQPNKHREIVTISNTVAVSTITTSGNAFSAPASNVPAYCLNMLGSTLDTAISDALGNLFETVNLPFTTVTDGDMQTSGVANWTAQATAGLSKVTTAANVPLELAQAFRVLNSGANGAGRSTLTRITRGKPIYAWALCRANVGTATMTVRNASAVTIDSVSTTQDDWCFITKLITPATTDENIYFDLGGPGASDDTYWAACGFIPYGSREVALPSYCTDRNSLKSIDVAIFNTASGDEAGVYPLSSVTFQRLEEDVDYRVIYSEGAVTSLRVELKRQDLTNRPLFITAERPFSAVDSLVNETDLTRCPLKRHLEEIKYLVGLRYPKLAPRMAEGLQAKTEREKQAKPSLPTRAPRWANTFRTPGRF